jgi:hypothetical protein
MLPWSFSEEAAALGVIGERGDQFRGHQIEKAAIAYGPRLESKMRLSLHR